MAGEIQRIQDKGGTGLELQYILKKTVYNNRRDNPAADFLLQGFCNYIQKTISEIMKNHKISKKVLHFFENVLYYIHQMKTLPETIPEMFYKNVFSKTNLPIHGNRRMKT